MQFTTLLLLFAGSAMAAPRPKASKSGASKFQVAANSSCAAGSVTDFSKFSLQLPIGSPGSPQIVQSSQLCGGFSSDFFSPDGPNGALVMKVQGAPDTSDCVTTAHSKHCRTELREQNPSSWSPNDATNRLRAELSIPQNTGSVVIGQIHILDSISSKPVSELYIDGSGNLEMGVQTCRTCSQKRVSVGKVDDPTSKFTYEIRYEGGALSVSVNDAAFQTLDTFDLDNPDSYFKAGNYNQAGGPTEVHFYNIQISH